MAAGTDSHSRTGHTTPAQADGYTDTEKLRDVHTSRKEAQQPDGNTAVLSSIGGMAADVSVVPISAGYVHVLNSNPDFTVRFAHNLTASIAYTAGVCKKAAWIRVKNFCEIP